MSVLYIRDESGKFKAITTITGEKGEKGEAFTYDDFTPEQLESLRGPAGVAGPAGPVGPAGPKGEPGTPVVNEVLPDGIDAVSGAAVAAYVDIRVAQLGLYVLITGQPVPVTVNKGETATFTVSAVGKGLTYQWQYSTNAGADWVDSGENGNKTAVLQFTVGDYNGYLYRCEITDANGNKAITEPVMLTLLIDSVEVPQNVKATSVEGYSIKVTWDAVEHATGYRIHRSLTYSGGYSLVMTIEDGNAVEWIDTGLTAGTTYYYYMRAIAPTGTLSGNSYKASATVSSIDITKQPENQVAVAGDTVTFHVEAIGAVSYQWQVQTPSGSWNDLTWEGATTATMTRTLNTATVTYVYRCKLTDADGTVVYTDMVGFTSE